MTDASTLIARLHAAVPGASVEAGPAADQPTLYVPAGDLVAVARALRGELGVIYLADLAGGDFCPAEPRFEMVYHLAALEPPSRLRLKVRVPGGAPNVPSLTPLWPSADWLEREVWDLIGVTFDGHGDLRRLPLPEEWVGDPLGAG